MHTRAQCGASLYFPSHEPTVECCGCGQRHQTAALSDRRELSHKEEEFQRNLSELRLMYGGKKTPELVKVGGYNGWGLVFLGEGSIVRIAAHPIHSLCDPIY